MFFKPLWDSFSPEALFCLREKRKYHLCTLVPLPPTPSSQSGTNTRPAGRRMQLGRDF